MYPKNIRERASAQFDEIGDLFDIEQEAIRSSHGAIAPAMASKAPNVGIDGANQAPNNHPRSQFEQAVTRSVETGAGALLRNAAETIQHAAAVRHKLMTQKLERQNAPESPGTPPPRRSAVVLDENGKPIDESDLSPTHS